MDDAWPEHLLASNHPTREWRSRSEATWEAIRQDYLTGATARDLCDRYEVGLSTLRLKAKEGGWRRGDQDDSDLFPADADRRVADVSPEADLAAVEENWAELADRARFRLRRAIGLGRAAEAASWLRLYHRLHGLAAADASAPGDAAERLTPPALQDPGPQFGRESGPEPVPVAGPSPRPDPVDTVIAVARQIESIARRAAVGSDEAGMDALEAEIAALEARTAALSGGGDTPHVGPSLDALDSLDPVFSSLEEPAPPPDRATLLRSRGRRLELGLGVSDLDEALATLDRQHTDAGLSP